MDEDFEIYKKTVTIKGKEYTLIPLGGLFLPKLYPAVGKLSSAKEDETELFQALDEQTIKALHECAVEMFRSSGYNAKNLELFVSQNLVELIPVLVELHFAPKQ